MLNAHPFLNWNAPLLVLIWFGCLRMQRILSFLKEHANALKLLPLVAFAVPLLWLFLLDAGSFELMWKGRTFQLFFVWLIALELILGWESLQPNRVAKLFSVKTVAFIVALALPTLYVVLSYYLGLNAAIVAVAEQNQIHFAGSMALSTEYFVFAVLFCLVVFLQFGKEGLKDFSVPAVFLGIVGAIYTIDNVFPYGQFTPFQLFVPTTANLAASALNLMGYQTSLVAAGSLPRLTAIDPVNPARTVTFDIAWPCAGIESMLIFTVVALLFLKRMQIGWKAKTGYFAIGAAVTYLINIWRIASFYPLGMEYGVNSEQVQLFHNYYGPLYAIAWIVTYPLLILGSQMLWQKISNKKFPDAKGPPLPQPIPS